MTEWTDLDKRILAEVEAEVEQREREKECADAMAGIPDPQAYREAVQQLVDAAEKAEAWLYSLGGAKEKGEVERTYVLEGRDYATTKERYIALHQAIERVRQAQR